MSKYDADEVASMEKLSKRQDKSKKEADSNDDPDMPSKAISRRLDQGWGDLDDNGKEDKLNPKQSNVRTSGNGDVHRRSQKQSEMLSTDFDFEPAKSEDIIVIPDIDEAEAPVDSDFKLNISRAPTASAVLKAAFSSSMAESDLPALDQLNTSLLESNKRIVSPNPGDQMLLERIQAILPDYMFADQNNRDDSDKVWDFNSLFDQVKIELDAQRQTLQV